MIVLYELLAAGWFVRDILAGPIGRLCKKGHRPPLSNFKVRMICLESC